MSCFLELFYPVVYNKDWKRDAHEDLEMLLLMKICAVLNKYTILGSNEDFIKYMKYCVKNFNLAVNNPMSSLTLDW